MIKSPKLSVIIVSYNFEKYLDECIQSIIGQTLQPMEILICDDASTDKSWNIIENYRAKFPKLIKTVHQDKNVGPYGNFMAAYKMVSGDWVSAMDGDDCWLPQKLEKEWNGRQ
jgi:glycosyltransferase involved in cell wall biosynthesis